MKTLLSWLCCCLLCAASIAQSTIDAGLANQLRVNKTTLADAKKLLGEPAYASNDASLPALQYRAGKNICMLQFNKEQLLTDLMIVLEDQPATTALYYENVKSLAALHDRNAIQKLLGAPLQIKVSAGETTWNYKNGDKMLELVFGNTPDLFAFQYAEQNPNTISFTSKDIDFLQTGKSVLPDVLAKLGAPSSRQLTNDGEQWIYRTDQRSLMLLAGKNEVVTNYVLESR